MRYLVLITLLVTGCSQGKSGNAQAIAPKTVSAEVKTAWAKTVPQGESYFVVAYVFAHGDWTTMERDERSIFGHASPKKDHVPFGDDFSFDRPEGAMRGTAKENAQDVALQAAEYPLVSFVCIVDARACKVTGTYVLKDKALAPAAMPKDVNEKLTAYLYYLQHAAAGYTRQNLP